MSVFAGPSISTNGLILLLDAADEMSYDGRENLFQYSEQFDNAAWNKNFSTASANISLNPFNVATADRLTETSDVTGQYHSTNQTITKPASSIQYTFSVYAKTAGREILGLRMESSGNGVVYSINLNTGAVVSTAGTYGTGFSGAVGVRTALSNGWYRIALTVTTNTSTSMFAQLYLQNLTSSVYVGDGTSGVFVWGAQLERSSTATNYAPTIATTFSRGTNWFDLSGSGNHATIFNGVAFNNNNNGIFNFDNVDDYAKVNNAGVLPTAAYTKIVWFRPETNASNNLISGGANDHAFWMNSNNNLLRAGHNGAWSTVSYTHSSSMLNQWWQGAVSFSTATGWVLYLNGNQVATNGSTTAFPSASDVRIGAYQDAQNLFDGDIPIAQIYNRALTSAEIRQNFNALRGRFGI